MLVEDYMSLWVARRFDWSNRATCIHYAAGWVKAIEGFDPLARVPDFRGRFAAGSLLCEYGSLRDAVTQALGRAPLASARMAQVGDIVLLPGQFFGTLGICNGLRAAVLLEEGGTGFVEMDKAEAAWRVGSE